MSGVPDYLSIGDFSRATHLTVKTLRHYHQVGLLEPADIDPQTGYRRYATGQIPAAQVIRRFRDLDMPLEQIQAVLAAPDLAARNQQITAHLSRLEDDSGAPSPPSARCAACWPRARRQPGPHRAAHRAGGHRGRHHRRGRRRGVGRLAAGRARRAARRPGRPRRPRPRARGRGLRGRGVHPAPRPGDHFRAVRRPGAADRARHHHAGPGRRAGGHRVPRGTGRTWTAPTARWPPTWRGTPSRSTARSASIISPASTTPPMPSSGGPRSAGPSSGPAAPDHDNQARRPRTDSSMTLQSINPDGLPVPRTYSQVVIAAGSQLAFIAGQEPEDAQGHLVGPGDLAAQARQVFDNLGRALAARRRASRPGGQGNDLRRALPARAAAGDRGRPGHLVSESQARRRADRSGDAVPAGLPHRGGRHRGSVRPRHRRVPNVWSSATGR